MSDIRIDTDLVHSTIDRWKNRVRSLLDSGKDLVIDLSQVTMMDSKGIALLLQAYTELSIRRKKLTVIGVSPELHELMRSMRMDQHMEIKVKA